MLFGFDENFPWTPGAPDACRGMSRVRGSALVFGIGFGDPCRRVLLDEYLACHPILGSVHPYPTARSHSGRLPRQAGEPRWSQLKPSPCISRISNFHCCMCAFAAPTGGQASGRNQSDRLVARAAALMGQLPFMAPLKHDGTVWRCPFRGGILLQKSFWDVE